MVDTILKAEFPGWHARVESQREANLLHPERGMRAGTEYTIGLMSDGVSRTIGVVAFLADDVSAAVRADREYQQAAVLRQVFARLEAGWTPSQGDLPALVIGNPAPGYRHKGAPRQTILDRALGQTRP